MIGKKYAPYALIAALVIGALVLGCDEDTNYDQRTVLIVSNINDGLPYLSDVINQGDSLYDDTGMFYNMRDDYIEEDWVKVQFHNRPYNTIINPDVSSLGDFLVTGYDVVFTRLDGQSTPVPPFTGKTSILVSTNSFVEAYILLVPYYVKDQPPLDALQYGRTEIMAHAHITFHGHEVQTDREIDFSASLTVNFADPFETEEQK